MSQIRMTPESMRERSRQYQKEADKVQEVIRTMDTLLQQLQTEWEGEASRSYANRYGELRPGFVRAQELITEISSALTKSAQIVEETDQKIADAFRI